MSALAYSHNTRAFARIYKVVYNTTQADAPAGARAEMSLQGRLCKVRRDIYSDSASKFDPEIRRRLFFSLRGARKPSGLVSEGPGELSRACHGSSRSATAGCGLK